MNWTPLLTNTLPILGTFLACFSFLYREMRRIEDRLDKSIDKQATEIKAQSARSDKLYEMFIDLLKERKV